MIMKTQIQGKAGKVGKVGGLTGLALLATLGLGGCGQTSFFEVTVMVANVTTGPDISMINSCFVTVSGAAKDMFTLNNCMHVVTGRVGVFEYGTEAESGSLTFHVDVFDGNQKMLGQGENSGMIKKGGHQTLTVAIAP